MIAGLKRTATLPATIRGVPLSSVPRIFSRTRWTCPDRPTHVFICLADHYEPFWKGATHSLARKRVERWVRDYPRSVEGVADSLGRPPQHSFFYPAEQYDEKILDSLAGLCRRGTGDVEVHLHHDNDTSEGVREKIEVFTERLHHRHGLLRRERDGTISYGFIHGNWALCNARPDGRWCGVNDELTVLRKTGCYADFTLPCAPSPGQTRMVNSIYYAVDDPIEPKSHDLGTPACVGSSGPPDGLLMIQGPLAWNWRSRKWGLVPRLENGDIHGRNGPSRKRLDLWLSIGIGVVGRPEWIFVKLHTHGAMEVNAELLLGDRMRRFHQQLADFARSQSDLHYYYVTARQMTSLVRQAEQGLETPDLEAAAACPQTG